MMAKGPDNVILSGNSRVKLTISGFVNRGLRFASSGDMSEFNSVESTESPSRVTFRGSGNVNKNISVVALAEFATGSAGGRYGLGISKDDSIGQEAGGTIGLRHSVIDVTHKDMGTLSIGHSTRAEHFAVFTGFTGTSHVNSVASGPSGDNGIMAEASDGMGTVARLGNHAGVNPGRENRLLYKTPSVMGLTIRASLNQARGWSLGAAYSGPPNVKDISVALAFGYRNRPNLEDGATTFGMSGGVQHNPSGLSVNGVYSQHAPKGGDKHTTWGAEVAWTGQLMDTGATSLTVGYGKYERGVEESSYYHLTVNQSVDAASADVYGSVASDSGTGMADDGTARDREGVLSLLVGTRVKF